MAEIDQRSHAPENYLSASSVMGGLILFGFGIYQINEMIRSRRKGSKDTPPPAVPVPVKEPHPQNEYSQMAELRVLATGIKGAAPRSLHLRLPCQ